MVRGRFLFARYLIESIPALGVRAGPHALSENAAAANPFVKRGRQEQVIDLVVLIAQAVGSGVTAIIKTAMSKDIVQIAPCDQRRERCATRRVIEVTDDGYELVPSVFQLLVDFCDARSLQAAAFI